MHMRPKIHILRATSALFVGALLLAAGCAPADVATPAPASETARAGSGSGAANTPTPAADLDEPDGARAPGGAALLGAPPIPARGEGVTRADGRPLDVLLISIDTLRADRLGCYGHERPTSPTIDALAARGVRFTEAYAPDCGTAQSHATLFTGTLPAAHGVYNAPGTRMRVINPKLTTVIEVAKTAGYQTVVHTEGGQLQRGMGFDRGADSAVFRSKGMRRTMEEFQEVLDFAKPDEPLFAFFHTYEVHAPYLPPRTYDGERFHGRFTEGLEGGTYAERYETVVRGKSRSTEDARNFLEPFEGRTAENDAWLAALYDEGVAFMDHLLADVLADWDRRRGLENTLVVLVSDHGEELGESGRFGHPLGLGTELTHIPFIVAGPGVESGTVDGPVGLRAVVGTILEHLGLSRPAHMEISLAPLLRAESPFADEARAQVGVAHQQVVRGTTLGVVDPDLHIVVLRETEETGERRVRVLYGFEWGLARPENEQRASDLRALGLERFAFDEALRSAAPTQERNMGASAREQLRDLGYTDDGR
ncbi:Choline-sulfatase [Planctomycetes bacterium Pla163]|uniref:Choline-sulfatase n=1 Tax=Rohdeia mirabilis TaxID=2528008 RepID=A0A518CYP3_9BACT|nr:Choline-sulfatase [Planctomycetes bacterium Pla163]